MRIVKLIGLGNLRFKETVSPFLPFFFCSSYLTAARETLVVARRPAGSMSVMLVLKEAGIWVFLQLLWVIQKKVVELSLFYLRWAAKLTGVWNMNLEIEMCVWREKPTDGEGWYREKKQKVEN